MRLDRSAKKYILVNEFGGIVRISNMRQFCDKNKLDSASMYEVANGKRESYKGYRQATLWNIADSKITAQEKKKTDKSVNLSEKKIRKHLYDEV